MKIIVCAPIRGLRSMTRRTPMGSNVKTPARQKGRISPEEWEAIQAYKAELKRQIAEVEEAERQERRRLQPPRLYGYIRCSHRDSEESGKGLKAQHDIIERWVEFIRRDYPSLPPEVTWVEDLSVSAFKIPFAVRERGSLLHAGLNDGDHVVFAYHDRAFRNTVDCLTTLKDWKKRGVVVHFADIRVDISTAQGEMFITSLASHAQMESGMKSERVKEVFSAFKDQGRKSNGHAPMGFKLVGQRGANGKWAKVHVAPDPEARRVMAEIVRVRDKYGWSFAKISDYVEEWLAAQQSRQASKPWEKRKWAVLRCARAYKEELALRKRMNGNGDQAALP
jgi:DNA invertase Pin-like site-specific DNA recombinase